MSVFRMPARGARIPARFFAPKEETEERSGRLPLAICSLGKMGTLSERAAGPARFERATFAYGGEALPQRLSRQATEIGMIWLSDVR
jgi:hypothetical protein